MSLDSEKHQNGAFDFVFHIAICKAQILRKDRTYFLLCRPLRKLPDLSIHDDLVAEVFSSDITIFFDSRELEPSALLDGVGNEEILRIEAVSLLEFFNLSRFYS